MTDAIVFSYGTLQLPRVQQTLYGRTLESVEDVLPGYAAVPMPITDPAVIEASGSDLHLALVPTDDPEAAIPGKALRVTEAELVTTDAYEGTNYRRIEVTLASGTKAFVYVGA